MDLNGILIDRIQTVIAESMSTGDLLYALTQVSEASIEVSAESRDATDKDGNLIRRFWNAKTCTLTLTNTMLDLNMVASQSGTDKITAVQGTSATHFVMPRIIFADNTENNGVVTLNGESDEYIADSIQVNAMTDAGTIGAKIEANASAATENKYYLNASNGTIALPTSTTQTKYIVKFNRTVTADATKVINYADKFPKQVTLTLKVLAVDPCESDVLRAMYVVFPAFNPSPESTYALSTDSTFDYTGEASYKYCDGTKVLYYIAMASEEEDEE